MLDYEKGATAGCKVEIGLRRFIVGTAGSF